MRLKVFCRIDGYNFEEEIECQCYFIKEGAYIFLKSEGWGSYDYGDVIKTFPVMFTIVERIIEKK
jgi:hypothetical protein